MAGLAEIELETDRAAELTRAENIFTAQQVEMSEGRLIGFFSVNPLAPYAIEEIQYWASDDRLSGLKLHLANSNVSLRPDESLDRLFEVLETAADNGFPVLIHMRNRQPDFGASDVRWFIDEIVTRIPDLKLIVAHFGGWGGFDTATEGAMNEWIEAFDSSELEGREIYFDISAVLLEGLGEDRVALFVGKIRELGLDKIVLGSDWDGYSVTEFSSRSTIDLLREAGLSQDEITTILSNRGPITRY